jgi:peptidoglycan/xylan/chitin deacetylase (PgdA/CDA1 family)
VPTHFRSALKHNVSRLFERSSDLLGATDAARTIVLCYHSISDDPNGLAIQPGSFARHIAVLREMGYEFLTFGDLVHRVMCTGSPRENVAVLTFDDGFEDNFTTAVPIMQKLNVPGTFFITSGLLERDSDVIASFRRLTGYEAPYLSAAQARQMYEGGFEIGAHTHTHPNLRRLAAGRARWEIMHSKQVLEGVIGGAVRSFAYPFGKRHIHYTAETVNFVREAGYAGSGAVAFRGVTSRKSVRIYEIPRFFITNGDGEEQFRQKVSGYFDWLGSFQELSPAWLKGLISPEDRY